MPLLPSPELSMDLTSEMINCTLNLSVLKRPKKSDSPASMANRMLLLVTLLGVHIREAANVFGAPEILLLILSYCDFPTVMSVSRANRHGRRVAQTVVGDRFRGVLSPYIPSSMFGSFVGLLEETGSGVSGSVARQMLALQSTFALNVNTFKFKQTGNLNVIAAPGQYQKCKQWFVDAGYRNWDERAVAEPCREYVLELWIGEKPICLDQAKNPKVMITHARSNIMDSVIASPLSIQTNLITGSFVYSLWPNLICQRDVLRSDSPYIRGLRRPTRLWPVHLTNGYWNVDCGKYCPCKDRVTSHDDVTASFAWNANALPAVDGTERVDDVWKGRVYVYRFMKRCRNTRCKNYSANRTAHVV